MRGAGACSAFVQRMQLAWAPPCMHASTTSVTLHAHTYTSMRPGSEGHESISACVVPAAARAAAGRSDWHACMQRPGEVVFTPTLVLDEAVFVDGRPVCLAFVRDGEHLPCPQQARIYELPERGPCTAGGAADDTCSWRCGGTGPARMHTRHTRQAPAEP